MPSLSSDTSTICSPCTVMDPSLSRCTTSLLALSTFLGVCVAGMGLMKGAAVIMCVVLPLLLLRGVLPTNDPCTSERRAATGGGVRVGGSALEGLSASCWGGWG
eukprot:CAMPEP_0173387598 /NCGR_PEP_ID=MMETSP1356-20130122/10079_1 /TAXON_ID=77927 ORGANISM="Hemiselmis virescens, Strain PCC157" /NCGR_SAMPLE_ID=MMETSP1356 /ASSEMBLY_ACC=CAM_ASM_000847 /LENGTH=103 /DNA_ID=CAMNT_0014344267 /DNA_START=195 /DNA_END=502 /DNA_ORIENTATION=+